jgi:hypothetical protein
MLPIHRSVLKKTSANQCYALREKSFRIGSNTSSDGRQHSLPRPAKECREFGFAIGLTFESVSGHTLEDGVQSIT